MDLVEPNICKLDYEFKAGNGQIHWEKSLIFVLGTRGQLFRIGVVDRFVSEVKKVVTVSSYSRKF